MKVTILVACVLVSIAIHAQVPVDPNLRFEVASIRPHDTSSAVVLIRMLPGGFEAIGVPVRTLLQQAFRVRDYQLPGVPDWVNTERYTINAKAPDGTPQSGGPTMLANLLKDRFKLATHAEAREMPAFALVRARADGSLGPSLKPSSAECHATMKALAAERAAGRYVPPTALPGTPGGPPLFDPEKPQCGVRRTGPGIVGGGGLAIADLVQVLSEFTGRPVVDKSGLSGVYDVVLTFTPEPGLNSNAPAGAPPISFGGDAPTLFTAVQEQLGLKLESVRAPVDVIVIDRIERPGVD